MRHKPAVKRVIQPDIKFNRLDIAKLTNYLMEDGKKAIAQKIIYSAFDIIAEKTKKDPVEVFEEAMRNIEPSVEVRSKRVGGGNYQIPVTVPAARRFTLAIRWLLAACKSQKGKPMAEKLANELINAFNKEGAAIKKKQDVYRMAEANRAFAHFSR